MAPVCRYSVILYKSYSVKKVKKSRTVKGSPYTCEVITVGVIFKLKKNTHPRMQRSVHIQRDALPYLISESSIISFSVLRLF